MSSALHGSKKGEDVKVKYSFSEFNSVVVEGISKAELSSIEGIKSIYPDLVTVASGATPYCWNLDRIDQSDDFTGSYNPMFCGGSGDVDVYVLDTGLDADHIEFYDSSGSSGREVKNIWSAYGSVSSNTDGHGHGTHVAGIADSHYTTR